MNTDIISERIQSRALNGYSDLVTRLGGDPKALLGKVGLALDALEQDDLPISLDHLAQLYETTAQTLNVSDFGLQLSRHQDTSLYGPLAQFFVNCDTVEQALNGFIKYFSFHTPGAEIQVQDASDQHFLEVRYGLKLGANTSHIQITEQSYGMACKLWRLLTPDDPASYKVRLSHAAHSDLSLYQQTYGCETLFSQDVSAIWLSRESLSLPLENANARLRDVSEEYVSSIIRHYPLNLAKQVEVLINEQLEFGSGNIDSISNLLGINKRTLQRRLAACNVVFTDLLDEIRKRKALFYLKQSQADLATVSVLLGYDEQSSFTRACIRWFDLPPSKVRSTLRH